MKSLSYIELKNRKGFKIEVLFSSEVFDKVWVMLEEMKKEYRKNESKWNDCERKVLNLLKETVEEVGGDVVLYGLALFVTKIYSANISDWLKVEIDDDAADIILEYMIMLIVKSFFDIFNLKIEKQSKEQLQ